MVSLDAFCAKTGMDGIDLLKVDVQGHEPAVLAGSRGLIGRRAIRTIFFELNWNRSQPDSCPAREAIGILSEAGYRFADPHDRMEFQPAGPWLERLSDVVASVA